MAIDLGRSNLLFEQFGLSYNFDYLAVLYNNCSPYFVQWFFYESNAFSHPTHLGIFLPTENRVIDIGRLTDSSWPFNRSR